MQRWVFGVAGCVIKAKSRHVRGFCKMLCCTLPFGSCAVWCVLERQCFYGRCCIWEMPAPGYVVQSRALPDHRPSGSVILKIGILKGIGCELSWRRRILKSELSVFQYRETIGGCRTIDSLIRIIQYAAGVGDIPSSRIQMVLIAKWRGQFRCMVGYCRSSLFAIGKVRRLFNT